MPTAPNARAVGVEPTPFFSRLEGFGVAASTDDRKQWLLWGHMAPAGSKLTATPNEAGRRFSR